MKANELGSKLQNHLKQGKVKTLKIVAIEAVKSITTNFEKEGRPAKWKQSIKSKKNKGTKIGVISGNLKKVSSSIDASASTVNISTNPLSRPYARRFNDGGTFPTKARTQKYQRTSIGENKSVFRFIKNSRVRGVSGTVKIKAGAAKQEPRPFMVIPDEDVPKFVDAVREGFK